jgi:folate-dependent phosphoribosylglycinamide formyltransferase PurN
VNICEVDMPMRITPLKVAVLCSHRAPGLVHLLNHDPRRGSEYEVVCCVTSADTFAEEVRVERRGVPCLAHPIRAFCRERGTVLTDLEVRSVYDAATADLLAPFKPDLVLLDSYLLLLTQPMLERFDGRIVNIHHSDLMLRNAHGGPRYPGLRAVRDGLLGGEPETRATAHVVTPRLDDGPVLLRSWPFAAAAVAKWALAHEALDVLRAYAWSHQEWMLREAWGPMLARTIELASLALEASGRPLDLAGIGRWVLGPDGSLAPDEQVGLAPTTRELIAES